MSTGRPPLDLRLIVITDAGLANPRTIEQVVAEALAAGAPAIQLRMKNVPAAELYRQATELRALTRAANALLFINDRLDVALATEADGVHLGPSDLPIRAARSAARAAGRHDLVIGASTDDPATAAAAAEDGADYIGCGAIFGTTSKAEAASERIGPQRLRAVVQAAPCPVVGIGGIAPGNVDQVARTGAAGAAVISAVMTAPRIGETVTKLLESFDGRRRK